MLPIGTRYFTTLFTMIMLENMLKLIKDFRPYPYPYLHKHSMGLTIFYIRKKKGGSIVNVFNTLSKSLLESLESFI